jgi:hypothetical protein
MMSSAGFGLADPNFWIELLPTRISVLQVALRVSPINNPPSHSSAPSDTRQTPSSKSCCSFHLFEAWQPVDPNIHRPHSDIFSSSRVTRPRIWPPGVKGLAILGLIRPLSHNFMHFMHFKCSRGPCPIHYTYQMSAAIHAGLPQGSYAHLSPGIRS